MTPRIRIGCRGSALCRRLDLVHCVDPFEWPSLWGQPAYYRLHAKGGAR